MAERLKPIHRTGVNKSITIVEGAVAVKTKRIVVVQQIRHVNMARDCTGIALDPIGQSPPGWQFSFAKKWRSRN